MSSPVEEVLPPRAASEHIAAHAQHVSVCTRAEAEAIAREHILPRIGEPNHFGPGSWRSHILNPQEPDDSAAQWIFVVDTLNFSFWVPDGTAKFTCEYRGVEYESYWALCACVNRAIDEGFDLTSARVMASVTREQLAHVFRSSSPTPVPLLDERVQVLNESGSVLLQEFDGSFAQLLRRNGNSCLRLVSTVVKLFESYRDHHIFAGKRVAILKRAQILAAELWACFCGTDSDLAQFTDIDQLTMFADYRVPQMLVHLGALKYDVDLLRTLKSGEMLVSGDPREVEIRGCSIAAVEELLHGLRHILEGDVRIAYVNAVTLDFWLWDAAKALSNQIASIPIHHTRSVFY